MLLSKGEKGNSPEINRRGGPSIRDTRVYSLLSISDVFEYWGSVKVKLGSHGLLYIGLRVYDSHIINS